MNNEQWKNGGTCNKCRKQAYCGKKCTAHKRRVMYEMENFIREKMDEMSGGVYSQIMEHSPYKEQQSYRRPR